ncbi:MAG: putative synthase, similar to eukaryotic protein [Labilithrix sp.]|nr:putative synthase, similar to eukaryotic protein [Labilithrix sp.]
MHWKIRRDPYLATLAERSGDDAVFAAGFFLDEDDVDSPLDDVDWHCTPVPEHRPAERPVVLLSTGGFCPPHAGHLAMMARARVAAEKAGFTVLGGYLSPGHDAYLTMKCGPAAIPASVRLRMCAEAIARDQSDWLLVDPWEALHRRVSVNYTDVTARLRAYLRAHLDPRIEVLYVCGGDNARFGRAFVDEGGCVIVGRRGAEAELASWRRELDGCARILWSEGDHPASSRAVRAARWSDETKKRLVLRIEDARAVHTLGITTLPAFQDALASLLGEHAAVRRIGLDASPPADDALSLDAMVPARHNLAVSRLYALGGYRALAHVARPGAPPLAEQLAAIPPRTYTLHDDDRMTGGTLAAVRAMLPPHVRIAGTRLAIAHEDDEEVVDSRDFLLGADEGGLVVALPDRRLGRAPYVLPYVDPAVRCCVPPQHVREFSVRVWALNERTFAGTGLCVRDLPAATRATFRFLGEERLLEDVCRWHVERLERLRPPGARP